MRFCCLTPALAGLVLLSLTDPAAAWHRDGHWAIARVAWKQLNEAEQLRIAKVLKTHPHYEMFLTDGRPKDAASEIEYAFAQAAVWSDWVRKPAGPGLDAAMSRAIQKEYNRPVWHYVNLPFIHPRDKDRFDAAAIRKEILEPALDEHGQPRHVLAALDYNFRVLRSVEASAAERGVALCWMAHLVGDLHMPLHATALIATDPPFDPPHGDLGGNRVLVKPRADGARVVNLHFYWDAALFRDEPGFAAVDGVVARLLSDPQLARDRLPELKSTDFADWAEESLQLAKSVVYRHEGKFIALTAAPPGKKSDLNGAGVPSLPDGYEETTQRIAARRMVLAGYRLADRLRTVFGK